MQKRKGRAVISVLLAIALLFGSVGDFGFESGIVYAAETEQSVEYAEDTPGTGDGTGDGGEAVLPVVPVGGNYRYAALTETDGITFLVSEAEGITKLSDTSVYRIDADKTDWFSFEAFVSYGQKIVIPEKLQERLFMTEERMLTEEGWQYSFTVNETELSAEEENPCQISLIAEKDMVAVTVNGAGIVQGTDQNGMAQMGSEVSIEVTTPGQTLNRITEDEEGNTVYTAMELDYENRYTFTVTEEVQFVIVDPETADYYIFYADTRKAKLTGEAGIQLKNLDSSAQGYNEIVLNFTAVKDGSDGTENEKVYYEVMVKATPLGEEILPAGSSTTPRYFYIPKKENTNTQSKSIKVNNGDLSSTTGHVPMNLP